MSPEEFQRIGIRMYGRKHWRREYSINLGLDASTIWRISTRTKDIPAVVEVAVRGLLEKHKVRSKLEKDAREQRARERHRYKGKASRCAPPKPKKRKRLVIHYNPVPTELPIYNPPEHKEDQNVALEIPTSDSACDHDAG